MRVSLERGYIMRKLLDRFDDYTIHENIGFKIKIGRLVVNVVCHNYLDAYAKMEIENNGVVGRNIDFSKIPRNFQAFTFCGDNAEVVVFDQDTGKYVTDKFIEADEHDNIAYGVSPMELIDVLVKVRDYEM